MAHSQTFQRAERALKAGSYDEAKKLFREDEEANGSVSDTRAKLQAAEAKLAAGDVNAAAALYEAVLEVNPSIADAYAGLARVALFTNQLDAAKVHAMAAVRLAPRQGVGWTLVGLTHESLGEMELALDALKKGAELSPEVFLCQLNLGRVLAAQGKAQEAVAALTQATTIAPQNPDAFLFLGMAYRLGKQHRLALRALEKAKDLAPRSVSAWATLGDVLFELKEFKAARDVFDLGLKACGDHPALLEKALAATMMLDDAPAAVGYLERELLVAPDHEQAWLNLANVLMLTGDLDKAEQVALELLEKNPKQWEAHFALGNLYAAVPLAEKAEQAYRKAIALAPENFRPLVNLATLFVEGAVAAQHAEAVTLLEKAAALAPANEWRIPYNQALAWTRLGKRDRALELVRGLMKKAPADHPLVAEARKLESNLLEG
ncbi:MAG: tetratricopeptide repeat protein [Myxococcus sp.]|nr:tetratricopeptide repeat protein [Myxococcus sp.]